MTLPDQFASDDLTIHIIRSARRKKTVGARLVNWYTLEVLAPTDIPDHELRQAIDSFVAQVRCRHQRQMTSDQALQQRAERLNKQLLGGQARWRSIRFVGNQRKRFGSCSPATGDVRISKRLASVPDFVLDYVIVHELAHLLEPNHSRVFWDLVNRYGKTERARGYLLALQLDDESDDQSADLDDVSKRGMSSMRIETDSLGQVQVPDDALWGAQTQRAVDNFRISGLRQHTDYITASALVKRAAAEVNMTLGQLDLERGCAIVEAANEIVDGRWREQFVVDPFQAGAGTSHNMNTNEVIANLANERLGGQRGVYKPVNPNDHVNMAQSTNDFIPTVIRVAAALKTERLLPVLDSLVEALEAKAREFNLVLKSGRTHLQDAVPVRLGQEFGAYAQAVRLDRERIARAADGLRRLGIGGTATGTGLNSHPNYHLAMVAKLSELTGLDFRSSGNLFESMQSTADFVDISSALRTLAVTLTRIANDLRLLSSGPTTGLDEIVLPPVQPGSSIMPGKVNPVMAEMLNMVCYHVMGNDQAIMACAQAGQLELNVMMPIMAYNLLQSFEILTNAIQAFTERCVQGITANVERCRQLAESSLGLATALNSYIGYAAAAKVAQEALARRVSLAQVAREQGYLTEEQLQTILDPIAMTEPGIPGKS